MSQVYLVWFELNHWVVGQYLCHRSICLVRAQSLGCRPVFVSQVYLFSSSSITGLKASTCVTGLFA